MISDEMRQELINSMRNFCKRKGTDFKELLKPEDRILELKGPELSKEFHSLVPFANRETHYNCIFTYGNPIQCLNIWSKNC